MPARDFFVFCTSLLPVELRALGHLSEVRHLPEGKTIYTVGDLPDALYIVKRGTVALEPGDANRPAGTYLSRGDVFGDLELLTERPRQDIARTKEAVSLQCFRHEDFPELIARVPSFFRYLCDHLAHRLIDARHAALSQIHDLELSGSLTNFDLVTIYQTIVQSQQTGELSIVDQTGRRIAIFRFEAGQPVAGHFRHLSGEEAFWQLFLAENLQGTFSFSSRAAKEEQSYEQTIDRNATDLLFEAIHLRDEFQELKKSMPVSAFLELEKPGFSVDPSESEISRTLMEEIWHECAEETTTLAALSSRFPVCELKVYQAVRELMTTGHLGFSEPSEAKKVA